MALKIIDGCTSCDICEPECPNEAISYGQKTYLIDPALCTECVGFYDEPTCVKVCPVDCIPNDPNHVESKDQLMAKFLQLTAAK